ncbi:MAG: N-succinylarginine dihydrolase [Phycisphaerae bacterium]
MRELNLDGLVGPSHNYAGLSKGNIASMSSAASVAHPLAAAVQGLAKMRRVASVGSPQGVLPPHPRPDLPFLRRVLSEPNLDPGRLLKRAHDADPTLLAAAWSASAMWTANAATVSPAPDTADGRCHLTVANLLTQRHRALEPGATEQMLRTVFSDSAHFAIHAALPAEPALADEGAANHTRLCGDLGERGLEIFTFGRDDDTPGDLAPKRFPARQTLAACRRIAELHGLSPDRTLFVRQDPEAIDAGVFHNDVACVGTRDTLLIHERAWAEQPARLAEIGDKFRALTGRALHVLEVSDDELPLDLAVSSYLFNSQLLPRDDGRLTLVHPLEVEESSAARAVVERLLAGENPIDQAVGMDVRQSMKNGGGPACLRLRMVVPEEALLTLGGRVLLDDTLYERLLAVVEQHYRADVTPADLQDERLVDACARATAGVYEALELPMPG